MGNQESGIRNQELRNNFNSLFIIHDSFPARGQGLLETIVAIGVIMTGLISVMSLVVSNLNTQRDAAMRYQAVNFAREGVELMRNRRDTNWSVESASPWAGLEAGDFVILLDPQNAGATALVPASPESLELCQDEAGFFVQHLGGCISGEVDTPFSRRVKLTRLNCGISTPALDKLGCELFSAQNPVALRVVSEVSWQQGERERNVTVNAILYDWR